MNEMATPICVVPSGDYCGEGAVWCPDSGHIYWTDINRFLLHAFDPLANTTKTWLFDEPVTALARTKNPKRLLVALASQLIFFDTDTETSEPAGLNLDAQPNLRFNDGRVSPAGQFWISTMLNNVRSDGSNGAVGQDEGELLAFDKKPRQLLKGLGIPNTLCWSPDKTRFYFADTLKNEIRVYDYNLETDTIGASQPFFAGFERGLPDGSAIDSEGFLWNCRYGGGCVVRIAPDGRINRIVELPVQNVTTCAFGGANLDQLYITTASDLSGEAFHRLSGGLFRLDVATKGMLDFVLADAAT